MSPRILGTRVPARLPDTPSISLMVFGEAPGPRGADKSRIPFWGDRSGELVYQALVDAGRCEVPRPIDELEWDGAALRRAAFEPRLIDTALSNAYVRCPTSDGEHFRAPTRAELTSAANVRRLRTELVTARARGLRTIVVLGRHADWMLGTHLGLRDDAALAYHQVIHPSPLGLLALKRRLGDPSLRMAALQRIWCERFTALLPPVARTTKR